MWFCFRDLPVPHKEQTEVLVCWGKEGANPGDTEML